MKDGTLYEDATGLRDLGDVFLFRIDGKTLTIQKKRIARITTRRGRETLYEDTVLTVEKVRDPTREAEFIFQRNSERVAVTRWGRDGAFNVLSGRIPDGDYIEYYDSGKVEREFSVRQGTLNGPCLVYYENGKIERRGVFRDGREEGTSQLYFNTGELKGEATFSQGVKHGETRLYFRDGALKSVMTFEYGNATGSQRMYYPSGQLAAELTFAGGLKEGPIRQYYESGKLKFEATFENNRLNGTATTYYESGRIKKRQLFRDGSAMETSHLASAAAPARQPSPENPTSLDDEGAE